MYNYLNYFSKLSVREIFKGENNIEKAYNDLVFNNKKIDDVHYKKVNNELNDSSKNIFQEAKKLFDLRVRIYKKLVLEEENSMFEKIIGATVKLKNQKDDLPKTPEQKEFNDFLEQIKEQQKNIDINWFENVFNYQTPNEMLKYVHSLKKIDDITRQHFLLTKVLQILKMRLKLCQKVKKQGNKNIRNCQYS